MMTFDEKPNVNKSYPTAIMKHDRLTVSLAAGQRKALKKIAGKRHASLGSVIRCALEHFIKANGEPAQNPQNRQTMPNAN